GGGQNRQRRDHERQTGQDGASQSMILDGEPGARAMCRADRWCHPLLGGVAGNRHFVAEPRHIRLDGSVWGGITELAPGGWEFYFACVVECVLVEHCYITSSAIDLRTIVILSRVSNSCGPRPSGSQPSSFAQAYVPRLKSRPGPGSSVAVRAANSLAVLSGVNATPTATEVAARTNDRPGRQFIARIVRVYWSLATISGACWYPSSTWGRCPAARCCSCCCAMYALTTGRSVG